MIDFILHIDAHLLDMVQHYGVWVYALIFAIIFCETGLVVTPFLPGDSLLFAIGALAATGVLDPVLSISLIIGAAFLGDNCNYFFGRWLGPKVFTGQHKRFFKPAHMQKTQDFYDRHGSKTVIMARFVPIVRTFAPFVAGIGRMPWLRFVGFSAAGSLLWVTVCVGAGYLFGNFPIVKQNFSLVVLAIVALSALPVALTVFKEWRQPAA